MRPRLKPLHMIRDADSIRLIREPGVFFDIDDPGGHIAALLSQLDGSRTVPEIHGSLVADWPQLSVEDVAGAIKALDGSGLLTDSETIVPADVFDGYASNVAFLTRSAPWRPSPAATRDVLLAPHPALARGPALTAWTRLQTLDTVAEPVIETLSGRYIHGWITTNRSAAIARQPCACTCETCCGTA